MKSFLLITIIISLLCFHEVVYRAQLHQANPSMSGVDKESVLIVAMQLVATLTYMPSYRSWNQPYINDTISECAGPIECLYDMILVYNSENATTACTFVGGYLDLLNSTDSTSTAIAQEWISFVSFRAFLAIFSIELSFICLIASMWFRCGYDYGNILKSFVVLIFMMNVSLIFLAIVDHSVKPFDPSFNIVISILVTIFYFVVAFETFVEISQSQINKSYHFIQ